MENLKKSKPVAKSTPAAPVKTSSVNATHSEAKPVMHAFEEKKTSVSGATVFFVLVLMLALGLGAGYGAALISAKTGTSVVPKSLTTTTEKGKTFGNGDPAIFKDTAEGTVQEGGIDGEGQYHLVRTGGDSQNVYMTSSSVDLSQFIGKKVKVWGETQEAQKAGWLMDVGRVEIE